MLKRPVGSSARLRMFGEVEEEWSWSHPLPDDKSILMETSKSCLVQYCNHINEFSSKNGHTLPAGQMYATPVVTWVVTMWSLSCLKPAPDLFSRCPKVVSKLSQCCLKVVPMLSQVTPKTGKWSPFGLSCGQEMCQSSVSSCCDSLKRFNIFFEDRCDLKKEFDGAAGLRIGQDGYKSSWWS